MTQASVTADGRLSSNTCYMRGCGSSIRVIIALRSRALGSEPREPRELRLESPAVRSRSRRPRLESPAVRSRSSRELTTPSFIAT
eukprot:scaffold17170_cov62-Phaeocystis_antarctica.AAC.2